MDGIEARAGFPSLPMQPPTAAMPEGAFYTSPTSFPLEWTQGEGKRGRGVNWGTEETELLLDIYFQRQKTHAGNIHIYKLIADDMTERGYYRSPAQCKTRIHTLKRYYGNNALDGQVKGANSSKGEPINLGDCSSSNSADAPAAKRPRQDVSSDADVDISFPQVKIERIEEDDDEYANLEVTMGNPTENKRAETFTPSFGQFCAGVLTPPATSGSTGNISTSGTLNRSRSDIMAQDGVAMNGSAQGLVDNSKRRDSGNPSTAGSRVECIDVEDSQPSSNRSSGSALDVGVADPEEERRSIELARVNWVERMKAQGLYRAPSGGDVTVQSDAGSRMRQPMEMMDQRLRGMVDHGMPGDPSFNPRNRMFPNSAPGFPPQNPPNLPPMTRQRGVAMAAGGGNPGSDGWMEGNPSSQCSNLTSVMEKLIGHLHHMQNRYVELEGRRMDLEEKRLDMERRKMEMEERQKKEEREHQLQMMQLVTEAVHRGASVSRSAADIQESSIENTNRQNSLSEQADSQVGNVL